MCLVQDTRYILAVPMLLWVCFLSNPSLSSARARPDTPEGEQHRELWAAGLDLGRFFPKLKHSMIPAVLHGGFVVLVEGVAALEGLGWGLLPSPPQAEPHTSLPAAAELLLGCLSSHQSLTCNTWGSLELGGTIFPCSTSAAAAEP